MHDQLALKLQDELSNAIHKNASRGVLIDISTLEMVDSFIGRMVADISGMGKILGAETMLVGMQPAVAITLVELGLSLPGRGDGAQRGAWHGVAASEDRRGWRR